MNILNTQPLAARMRPRNLDEFLGQKHIIEHGKPLRQAIENGRIHSMVLWGPPGTGKTTLARLIAHYTQARFEMISAVFGSVKDIRAIVEKAQQAHLENQTTLLFVDEVHRFNKAQQDAFLPYVEDGTFIFIGATTENPSFELNNALLSRTRVYVLNRLKREDLLNLIAKTLADEERGLGKLHLDFPSDLQEWVADAADGDARQALIYLEIIAELVQAQAGGAYTVTEDLVKMVLSGNLKHFDKYGEHFYDQISALHKAVRGSDPDAALYWLVRMLEGGCDPLYIARRIVRMASEDIGNADLQALTLALNAWNAQERLGSPEGELALAQAIIYMACAPKSNAVYVAFGAARADVKRTGSLEVPLHLRNAPTQLMRDLNYGKEYRYPHDAPEAYIPGEQYFPDNMPKKHYYRPVERGLEIKIAAKLAYLRELDKRAKNNN